MTHRSSRRRRKRPSQRRREAESAAEAVTPDAAAIVAALTDEEAARSDWRETRRAPAPVRKLEQLAGLRCADVLVAREIVTRVLADHADAPDTRESWVAIYTDVINRADNHAALTGRTNGAS